MARLVVLGHQRQAQFADTPGRQRQADQPTGMLGHEVDRLGRRHLRRDDDVAFILPALVVDQNEDVPVARLLDDLFDRR